MESARSFEDLMAWQKAHALVLEIYKITQSFPSSETYGLTSQIRRAAVSIASNIAEGFNRFSPTEKIRFYNIAEASAEEVRYQLLLAHDLQFADTSHLQEQATEAKRLIIGLIKSIRARS
ncbi:four helix bundle protein [Sulfuriroseicoccus oceanibius]|uniref:Four helix bundle protein n=1 Tax=Sulfuriroseicoccus oceanibius TaxID=2707525 RepID=A0A6B3L9Y8_9BACT|nr:four helix bundle protein [Sulfuriroseicoccus oceanibius]QQL44268.1 four helix bundle protein [Sulfuriroseicoccus oceanibius]